MVELVTSMDSKKLHKTVFDFDLMLWAKLLISIRKKPKKTVDAFGLSPEVVQILTNHPEKINKLASGVLISFTINYNDLELFKKISCSIDKKLLMEGCCNYLDIVYWERLRDLSVIDIEMSSVVFSVPRQLAELAVSASNEMLYHLAIVTSGNIYLRYPNEFIHEILTEDNNEYPYFKKMMFALKSNKIESV